MTDEPHRPAPLTADIAIAEVSGSSGATAPEDAISQLAMIH